MIDRLRGLRSLGKEEVTKSFEEFREGRILAPELQQTARTAAKQLHPAVNYDVQTP